MPFGEKDLRQYLYVKRSVWRIQEIGFNSPADLALAECWAPRRSLRLLSKFRTPKKHKKSQSARRVGIAKQTGWCSILQHLFNYATSIEHQRAFWASLSQLPGSCSAIACETGNASLNSVRRRLLTFPNHCSEWRLRDGSWRNPAASLDSSCLFFVLESLFRPRPAARCLKAYRHAQLKFRKIYKQLACQNYKSNAKHP